MACFNHIDCAGTNNGAHRLSSRTEATEKQFEDPNGQCSTCPVGKSERHEAKKAGF